MERFSIYHDMKTCFFCGRPRECIHEVYYGTANRKVSIQNGFCVGLCNEHHNMSNDSVHHNREMDLKLKKEVEKAYLEQGHSINDFLQLVGKNYL